MARYLLDTNVCVDYLTGRFPRVVERLQALPPEEVCVSTVVVAELRYGAEKSAQPRRNHHTLDVFLAEMPCLDFDLAAAEELGRVRTELEREGAPVGPYDMLIAAHARSQGLVLVTDNLRELGRVDGLESESWR